MEKSLSVSIAFLHLYLLPSTNSYDIIVKGHNSSITADTKEGEFTEFTIMLSIT